MSGLSIGLIGVGSKKWIAGVNYLSSLLFANSLLPPTQQQNFHLFLHEVFNNEADYTAVSQYASSVNVFDFYYGAAFAPLRRMILPFRTAFLRRSFPRPIKNNLPGLLRDSKCQIIYPANDLLTNGPPSVKTISLFHDFQSKYFPENFRNKTYLEHKTIKALRLSDLVIVNNEFSKRDVQKFYPKYCHKIRVLPFTVWLGPKWAPKDHKRIIQKYKLPQKYLIFPSQFWVHKNHKRLFEAIAKIKHAGHADIHLVCTGYSTDHRYPQHVQKLLEYIDDSNIQNNLSILGFIPRKDQIQLLRSAAAIIQPSLFEGHSSTLVEAQSLGKLGFVSDIPMHRELCREGYIFFDPFNPEDIAGKIGMFWSDLSPGPDLDAEKLALEKYTIKMRIFGKGFSELCNSII